MPNSHGSFIWYELMTTDAEGAGRFYAAVVPGWTFGHPMPGPVDYRAISRGDGGNAGGVLQLDEAMRSGGAVPAWLGYIGVDDVDSTVRQLESRGGSVLMPAWDIPDIGRIAMVADPQSNPFYVMRGAVDAASDAFSIDAVGHIGWNELCAADPVAAREFYGGLFGWNSDDFMPMGDLGEYRFLAHQGETIGAVYPPQHEGFDGKKATGWRYYIRVPSIAAAKAAIDQNGGTVAMGPHEVPGGDWIIIGTDPQGAEFALVGKQ